MRGARSLLALSTLLGACSPGRDPALGACNTRAPGAVVIGTGEEKFEPIGQTVEVQIGPPGQGVGSYHVWFALRCKNLGPHVIATITIEDVATGQVLTPLVLREAIDLQYNADQGTDEVAGIRAFLVTPSSAGDGGAPALDPSMLTGRQIRLQVELDDECEAHAESEVVATVSGYHPPG